MRRKKIKGVLYNFLRTYTSRNSDYQGYWLFGMLVREGLPELWIDLLNPSNTSPKVTSLVVSVTAKLAVQKFQEQMERAGLPLSCVSEAYLEIARFPDLLKGQVNGRICGLHKVRFLARVVCNHGKTFESEFTLFIAPHNPLAESRSTRR